MTADIACFVPDGDAPPFSLSVNPRRLLYAERRARRQATIHVQPAAAAGRRPAALRLGPAPPRHAGRGAGAAMRSEEHTSEIQSLMRISYAAFCMKKQNKK